jgi:hypothetical protein
LCHTNEYINCAEFPYAVGVNKRLNQDSQDLRIFRINNLFSEGSETLKLLKNILSECSETSKWLENTLSECSETSKWFRNTLSEGSETPKSLANILSQHYEANFQDTSWKSLHPENDQPSAVRQRVSSVWASGSDNIQPKKGVKCYENQQNQFK